MIKQYALILVSKGDLSIKTKLLFFTKCITARQALLGLDKPCGWWNPQISRQRGSREGGWVTGGVG